MNDHNAHAWFVYFGDHPIGESKWGVHLETQIRRHDLGRTWQQFLARPGVNYQATKSLMLTAGYTLARTHSYSDFTAARPALNEHRLWTQAWFRYGPPKLRWSTRIRLENRFVPVAAAGGRTDYRYENRLRAWQQVTRPVAGRVYVTAYDELWLYVKPYVSNSAFDQNRAYAAVGFRLRPTLRLETGYMNQTLLQRSGAVLEFNHTMMFTLFSTAPFGRRSGS